MAILENFLPVSLAEHVLVGCRAPLLLLLLSPSLSPHATAKHLRHCLCLPASYLPYSHPPANLPASAAASALTPLRTPGLLWLLAPPHWLLTSVRPIRARGPFPGRLLGNLEKLAPQGGRCSGSMPIGILRPSAPETTCPHLPLPVSRDICRLIEEG